MQKKRAPPRRKAVNRTTREEMFWTKIPRVTHFEINADNPERAVEFYRDVFGWEIRKVEGAKMDYWFAKTGDIEEVGINGAIMPRKFHASTINTIGVPDIDLYLKRVLDCGGRIIEDKWAVQDIGTMAYVMDTEGNVFGLIQPEPRRETISETQTERIPTRRNAIVKVTEGEMPTTKIPRVVHFEINADNIDRAIKFYHDVFGWDIQKAEGMDYWLAKTGEMTEVGISGAIIPRIDLHAGVINTIGVPDIDLYLKRIVDCGGKIVKAIEEIPTIGLYAYVFDTEGNLVGIIQPNGMPA